MGFVHGITPSEQSWNQRKVRNKRLQTALKRELSVAFNQVPMTQTLQILWQNVMGNTPPMAVESTVTKDIVEQLTPHTDIPKRFQYVAPPQTVIPVDVTAVAPIQYVKPRRLIVSAKEWLLAP